MQALLIVSIIVVADALIWVPIVLWTRRRARESMAAVRAAAADLGEPLIVEPETAFYAASREGAIGVVRGTAVVALTRRRVFIRPLLGRAVDVAAGMVTGVSTGKRFHGSYRNGRTHVILKLMGGREVAVAPADPERWVAALPAAQAAGKSGTPAEPLSSDDPTGLGARERRTQSKQ